MNHYYVYSYLREDMYSPYYIGKGCGRRAYGTGIHSCPVPPRDRIFIIKENLSQEEALLLERTLINFFGREKDGGILLNRRQGGNQNSQGKNIVLGGVEYTSISACARALGVHRSTIHEWLKIGRTRRLTKEEFSDIMSHSAKNRKPRCSPGNICRDEKGRFSTPVKKL